MTARSTLDDTDFGRPLRQEITSMAGELALATNRHKRIYPVRTANASRTADSQSALKHPIPTTGRRKPRKPRRESDFDVINPSLQSDFVFYKIGTNVAYTKLTAS